MEHGWQTLGKGGALVIDGCGNPKAGKNPAGVNRQYCGNIGKVDNCQVGVFSAYTKGDRRMLPDYRLYVPAGWINDPARSDAAGIPKEHQVFKTKARLAYEMIAGAKKAEIPFTHITISPWMGSMETIPGF